MSSFIFLGFTDNKAEEFVVICDALKTLPRVFGCTLKVRAISLIV